ncbi:TlpA disulfide reductase family protein [Marinicella litoralis]|uniref:Thiol-disulfide isomerase/thioredoxin n=1 Tax=Marinicella litoralis TaxID=644220 RepID=A0A4R6XW53_9GAMM|nr:TlpA disulfide reductase family protein [Marinicella litoralis]TDR22799.1 thiol-disulfide isomerase/thioredoxin [Marinicella litoralis]
MKKILLLLSILLITACQQSSEPEVQQAQVAEPTAEQVINLAGLWRGVLHSPGGELPFGIQIAQTAEGYDAKILNGPERVDTSGVILLGNQLEIQFSWYDARIKASYDAVSNSWSGEWSKTAAGMISSLPFTATKGYPYRFKQSKEAQSTTDVAGIWQAEFVDEDGTSVAVGEFKQNGQKVNGTFLTPTGDYRFLSGHAMGGELKLSAFDGAHAFLFAAKSMDGQLTGDFWSRDTYHATWTAALNDQAYAVLPDSWDMVKITTDDNTVSFAFEDLNGQLVQLSDERFQDKPVLINLFGTWCPNCNDEAPVLAEFYKQYHADGLEIVGLAFEFTEDIERDKKQIAAFKQRHGIQYPLLRAGINDKKEAAKVLGFLDKVVAYPTSIFLDRQHQVVKIHSGFAGPGTGKHFTDLVEALENQIKAIVY